MSKLDITKENEVFEEVFKLCFEKKIYPMVAVHYSRNAYENEAGNLRISLDKGLSFHSLSKNVEGWKRGSSWRKDNLPKCSMEEDFVVLEVKFIGSKPDWLESILKNYKQENYSKFTSCMKAVYGI